MQEQAILIFEMYFGNINFLCNLVFILKKNNHTFIR